MFKLTEQQKRYTKFNGNPIHATFNQAAIHSPAVKAAGLTLVFNLATLPLGVESILPVLGGTALGLALSATLGRMFNWGIYFPHFREKSGTLCIDKKPDAKTPPTSPENLEKARFIRIKSAIFATTFAVPTALFALTNIALRLTAKENIPVDMAATLFLIIVKATGLMAECGSNFHRFNKVAKGDWTIVDLPKEKIERKAEIKVLNAVPQIG